MYQTTYKIGDNVIDQNDKWSGKIVGENQKFVFVMDARRTLATLTLTSTGPKVNGQVRIIDREKFQRKVNRNEILIIPVEDTKKGETIIGYQ